MFWYSLMKVTEKLPAVSNETFYGADFRAVLEDHMTWLRNHRSTRSIKVANSDAYRFEGDFYRYLSSLGTISRGYFWVIMRLNKMTSPQDFGVETDTILVPSAETLEALRKAHVTYHTI